MASLTNEQFEAIVADLRVFTAGRTVRFGAVHYSVEDCHIAPLRAMQQHPDLYTNEERAFVIRQALAYGSSHEEGHFIDAAVAPGLFGGVGGNAHIEAIMRDYGLYEAGEDSIKSIDGDEAGVQAQYEKVRDYLVEPQPQQAALAP